jgi:hypothetical protein
MYIGKLNYWQQKAIDDNMSALKKINYWQQKKQ